MFFLPNGRKTVPLFFIKSLVHCKAIAWAGFYKRKMIPNKEYFFFLAEEKPFHHFSFVSSCIAKQLQGRKLINEK